MAIVLGACQRREAAAPQRSTQGAVQGDNQGAAAKPAAVALLASHPASPMALARNVYRNVPVLGELDTAAFEQSMQDLVAWVAPQQGCAHCHVDGDAASDAKPAKAVARRMLQMVQHINNDWKPHVGQAGVTCYTCHRGQTVPPQRLNAQQSYAAFLSPAAAGVRRTAAWADEQADAQYGLMLHMSESLGADCRQCHDKPGQAATAGAPDPSAPARQTAAKGLRMLVDLNGQSLGEALGHDARATSATSATSAKVDCATCHQGVRLASAGAPQARDHAAMTLVPSEAPTGEGASGSNVALARARGGDACVDAAANAARGGARLGAALARRPVQGGQRVMLYAAPDGGCPMLELQLQPGEELEAFVTFADYTSVRYRRAATGSEARGWIRTERLGPGLATGPLAAAPAARTASSITPAAAATCRAEGDASESAQPQRGRAQVLGQGRLQFYSAPDAACPLRGIFILPGEPVETLHRLAGYTAVRYVNPRTGNQASGWVLSSRVSPGHTVLR